MARTQARSGMGTLFKAGDAATPEVFTTLAEVRNIGGPESTLGTDDATHMESPQNYEEVIPTLLASGNVTAELNFLPGEATQQKLRTDQLNRTLRNFRMILPGSGMRFAFAAYVASMTYAVPHDGKMSMNVTLRVSGPPTLETDS